MQQARLSIGLIGPGRAGAPVAAALERAGHKVKFISAISDFSKSRAKIFFPNAELLDPLSLIQNSDLVIAAVPDDELAGLVQGLAQSINRPGQFWVHLSGAHGLLPFLPIVDAGAVPLAIHPAMTFTGDLSDIERLVECPFGVTAPAQFEVVAQALVLEIGGVPNLIADADRPRYHAALTHASNHLNTLVSQAEDILRSIGIENPGAYLQPLTTNSLEHALASASAALTGPIRRGDVQTVIVHLEALGDSPIRDTYIALARATVDRIEKQLPAHVVKDLKAVLS